MGWRGGSGCRPTSEILRWHDHDRSGAWKARAESERLSRRELSLRSVRRGVGSQGDVDSSWPRYVWGGADRETGSRGGGAVARFIRRRGAESRANRRGLPGNGESGGAPADRDETRSDDFPRRLIFDARDHPAAVWLLEGFFGDGVCNLGKHRPRRRAVAGQDAGGCGLDRDKR